MHVEQSFATWKQGCRETLPLYYNIHSISGMSILLYSDHLTKNIFIVIK